MEVITKSPGTSLHYRLDDPGFTIYHRAALGGLAATVLAWSNRPPDQVNATVDARSVCISWDSTLSKSEALKRVVEYSFKLTNDNIIELPGHCIPAAKKDLKVAIHNGITQTFLQHPKTRPGDKGVKAFVLSVPGEEEQYTFTYKPVSKYAHQSAQGTGLFDNPNRYPETAFLTQALVPGAFAGSKALDARSDEVFLLMYLMVGSAIYHLRPRTQIERAQYCIIVPDVIDLLAFATSLRYLAAAGASSSITFNSFVGRTTGGAEESALRFLLDFETADLLADEKKSVAGCNAIAMGKVAWDANQINRSMAVSIGGEYKEIDVFKAASEQKPKIVKTKKGDHYIVLASHLPELIAANLTKGNHWCSGFKNLMASRDEARRLVIMCREELRQMKTAIKDENDIAVIEAFQDAWRGIMIGIYERSSRHYQDTGAKLDAKRLLEVEHEKVRNAILRCKNSEMLTNWFLRFCADATKTGPLNAVQNQSERIRKFIFDERNFERFQNLCLFALVSYKSNLKSKDGE